MVHLPAFPSQADINPRTAIPSLAFGNLPDPDSQRIILMASTPIPEHLAIEGQEPAYPPLIQRKVRRHPSRRGSLRLGRYQFFALMAFSAWMSSACSATICFNRRF
jgi:hypothetical protein